MYIATLFVLAVVAQTSDGTILTGTIQDENGVPIAGAIVDVYTAKPRVGAAITCPSCYRDCAKSTKTDAYGQFSIRELDSGLVFRVLVMAPGRRSQLTDLTDPKATELDVRLEPVPKDLPANQMLTGRVLDDQGDPLPGAVVFPNGAKTTDKRWWGQLPGVDEASITDSDGQFVITSQEPKLGLDLRVSAPGFADFPSQLFDLDGRIHEIRMQLGASAIGKLTFDGYPVANRSIGIVQRDRSTQTFTGERVLVTDHMGSFQFTDLQPNEEYVLYTLCERNQLRDQTNLIAKIHPILRTKFIETTNSGCVTQLGELKLEAGQTLTGRVTFPSGMKAPEEVKVRLSVSVHQNDY